jgi:dephospho-CoA kinase
MKRITIVGQPGGGKSILARLIGARPGLPGHVLRSPRAVRAFLASLDSAGDCRQKPGHDPA